MSDEDLELERPAAPVARPRPAGCNAVASSDLVICKKCGLDWPIENEGPSCRPITFEELRDLTLSLVEDGERSLTIVRSLNVRGMPTDGGRRARRRLALLEALLRLVEKTQTDPNYNKKAPR